MNKAMPIGLESQNWMPEIYYGLVKAVGNGGCQQQIC